MSSHNDSFVASSNSPTKTSKPDSGIESLEKLKQEAKSREAAVNSVTTEQLAEQVLQSLKEMSPEEKAKIREHLDREFNPVIFVRFEFWFGGRQS